MEDFETFIPYNQNKHYIFVKFVTYERDQETNELNKILISYDDKTFELFWDEYNYYYTGFIMENGKKVEGYIV